MKYLVFLDYQDTTWPQEPEWSQLSQAPIPFKQGYMVISKSNLLTIRSGPLLWSVLVTGYSQEVGKYFKFAEAKLVAKIEEWNWQTQRLFAVDCVEHVLSSYQSTATVVKQAMKTVRNYALGKVSLKSLKRLRLDLSSVSLGDDDQINWSDIVKAAIATTEDKPYEASHLAAYYARESIVSDLDEKTEHNWQINHLLTHYLNLNPEDFA